MSFLCMHSIFIIIYLFIGFDFIFILGTVTYRFYIDKYLFVRFVSWAGFELTTLIVIGTDCIGSYKSNYHIFITTTVHFTICNLCFRYMISVISIYCSNLTKRYLSYVIKFVSDLRQVGGFLRVLRISPPIKRTATI
jgi:hypothetical protein